MTPLSLTQGSPAWHAARARHFCASEAPAMLGVSKYTSRSELLAQKKTGITEEVEAGKQRLFDAGHEAEAKARPIAEGILGQDLFPMVGIREVDGLPLLASFDGLTMDESIVWETKLWNEELAQACVTGELDPHYWAQLEHQLIVSQADTVLFTTSDGTPERTAQTWYVSVPERRQQVIDGWKQFAQDLASYVPEVATAKPEGRTPETLPALRIEVTGMVTASNLAEYKAHALAVFDSINRELVTDAQFADAEKTIKWAGDVEDRLAAAKQHALSQTESIDELFRTIDDISAEARRVRLELFNLVKARKEQVRVEIVTEGAKLLAIHLEALNASIGKPYMPAVPADFGAAIKGKRTIESLRDAVGTTLANAKIAANAIADKIHVNLRAIREQGEHSFLFSDVASLVLKEPEFVEMVIKNRVAEHQAIEAARIETERQRIANEERAKAEASERARADAEIAEAKRASEEAIAKAQQATLVANVAAMAKNETQHFTYPAETVEPVKDDADNNMRLGQICEKLGFTITAEFLSGLGFEPSATEKNAKLYKTRLFPLICRALVNHINSVYAVQEA
jgi:putative phage-type endonuclease